MRVPTNAAMTGLIDTLNRLRTQQDGLLQQASSGRRLNRPSDDPIGAAQATRLRAEVGALRATEASLTLGRTALEAADSALGQMGLRIEDAITAGTQAASDLVNPADRKLLARQVREVATGLLADGNRKFDGYALFAGGKTLDTPLVVAPDGSFTYMGDGVVRGLELDDRAIALNLPGDRILAGPVNAGLALETLATAIEAGDSVAIAGALENVEALRVQVVAARTEAGHGLAALDQLRTDLLHRTERLELNIADVEDANIVEVATELNRVGQHIEANLGAARASQTPTLFDFLA